MNKLLEKIASLTSYLHVALVFSLKHRTIIKDIQIKVEWKRHLQLMIERSRSTTQLREPAVTADGPDRILLEKSLLRAPDTYIFVTLGMYLNVKIVVD